MAVLGLILLAAAGVLTAAVVTSNTDSLTVDLWGASVSNVTLGVVFVAGMITTVLAVVGLGLLMGAMRRTSRLRKERRMLRRENEQLTQQVEATPETTAPPAHLDDRTVVGDRSTVEPTPVGSDYDGTAAHSSTTPPSRRPFQPRREEPTHTETV